MFWWRPQLRVLFVCTANVCRSPLAEALLRHRLRSMGLARRIAVASAGTRPGQLGRPPDPRVARLAREYGFPLGRIRAQQVTPALLERSTHVLVMEQVHSDELAGLAAGSDALSRVRLLGEYQEGVPPGGVPVAITSPGSDAAVPTARIIAPGPVAANRNALNPLPRLCPNAWRSMPTIPGNGRTTGSIAEFRFVM